MAACSDSGPTSGPGSEDPSTTSIGDTSGTSDGGAGVKAVDASDFCGFGGQFNEMLDALRLRGFGNDSDTITEFFSELEALIDAISEASPADLSDDFAVLSEGYSQLAELITSSGFDFAEVDVDAYLDVVASIAGAAENIATRMAEECGLDLEELVDPADGGLGFELGEDMESAFDSLVQSYEQVWSTGREQVLCVLDRLDITAETVASEDFDASSIGQGVADALVECGVIER